MITDTVDKRRHVQAYGIQCQPLGRSLDVAKASVNVTHCVLEPGASTTLHQHRESETFFILSGQGRIECGDQTIQVGAGHTVVVPSFQDHVLSNLSDDIEFAFLSLYSDAPMLEQAPIRQVVLAAPPTPNGDLHLGHLGGPYLAADIYQRYLRLRERQVLFASGTDDFQNYVDAYREQNGIARTGDVVEGFRQAILATLKAANVQLDEVLSPSRDLEYQAFVQNFFCKIKGIFELHEHPTFFERETRRVVRESQIAGSCPSCQSKVVGNGCEECGFVGDVSVLKNPRHVLGLEVETRPVRRWMLNLRRLEPQIRQYLERESLVSRFDAVLQGETLFPISYPGDWGIACPDLPGQVLNVWMEMAAGYVYLAHKHGLQFLDRRQASTQLFCGIDNAFYYAVLIPVLLRAFDANFATPYRLQLNEFWNLDGKKFSTSRGHAIWGRDFLKNQDADRLRFYLAYKRPLHGREDFTMNDFEQTLQALQISSLNAMTETLRDLNVTKIEGAVRPDVLVELQDVLNQFEKNFLKPSEGVKRNAHLVTYLILRTKDLHARSSVDPFESSSFVYAMRILGTLLLPYMPVHADRILRSFLIPMSRRWIEDLSLGAAREEMQSFYEQEPLRRAE